MIILSGAANITGNTVFSAVSLEKNQARYSGGAVELYFTTGGSGTFSCYFRLAYRRRIGATDYWVPVPGSDRYLSNADNNTVPPPIDGIGTIGSDEVRGEIYGWSGSGTLALLRAALIPSPLCR
ncbi:MAG: hypothetical protein N3A38_13180 [Planctomycetota bacterium]|nr:hypothetical protein [Planctomycetota bacterium]